MDIMKWGTNCILESDDLQMKALNMYATLVYQLFICNRLKMRITGNFTNKLII